MHAINNKTENRVARTAGLIYLVVVITGIFSLGYVPSQLIVHGNASETVMNITAFESLFRLGIFASLVCYLAFLMLPFALYRLLAPVSKDIAAIMVVFAVASVPLSFANIIHKLEILSLLNNAMYLQSFTTENLHAEVMLRLDAYGNGLLVSKIFWGLWLLPFGYLAYKSGHIPRVLGVLLMAGCFGYLIDVAATVLFPGYAETTIARFITRPASLGEIGTCLWLLIVGARRPKGSFTSDRETV